MILNVKTHFDAAHFLPNYKGKCKNVHGHRWEVELKVEGNMNKRTGMLVDFKKLKEVLTVFDHKLINDTIENPTAELIVSYLYGEIVNNFFPDVTIKSLELWESPNCSVMLR